MTNISIMPADDAYETTLAQAWNGAIGTIYVQSVPVYTPTNTPTYIIVNPRKTNMQGAIINNYSAVAKTLTCSSITMNQAT